jgi:hypothetical protein
VSATDTLIFIERGRFAAVSEVFGSAEPIREWLKATFRRFDAAFEQYWDPEYEQDLAGDEDDQKLVLNEAFGVLVTKDSHGTDGSYRELTRIVSTGNQELEPVRDFFERLDFNRDLPASVHPVEFGLLGVWSPEKIEPVARLASRYGKQAAVRELYAARDYGWRQRLSGAQRRDEAIQREWLNEYFWEYWEALVGALGRAVDERLDLGLIEYD